MTDKEEKIKDIEENGKMCFPFVINNGTETFRHYYYPVEDVDLVDTYYCGNYISTDIDSCYETRESINKYFKSEFNKSIDEVRGDLYEFFISFNPDPETNILFEMAKRDGYELIYKTAYKYASEEWQDIIEKKKHMSYSQWQKEEMKKEEERKEIYKIMEKYGFIVELKPIEDKETKYG